MSSPGVACFLLSRLLGLPQPVPEKKEKNKNLLYDACVCSPKVVVASLFKRDAPLSVSVKLGKKADPSSTLGGGPPPYALPYVLP